MPFAEPEIWNVTGLRATVEELPTGIPAIHLHLAQAGVVVEATVAIHFREEHAEFVKRLAEAINATLTTEECTVEDEAQAHDREAERLRGDFLAALLALRSDHDEPPR